MCENKKDEPTTEANSRVEEILATCPPEKRDRYRERARRAARDGKNRSYRSAVGLKCLECCCWNAAEVSKCKVRGCALWGLRRKPKIEVVVEGSEEVASSARRADSHRATGSWSGYGCKRETTG
jgi:hypothetical protein